MRLRFWIGLAAVLLIAAGSVVAAAIVYVDDRNDFHRMQDEEAARAAHQTESLTELAIGQLASAAAFFKAEHDLDSHQFDIVARSLLGQGALRSTAFIARVPAADRRRFERRSGVEIVERRPSEHLGRAERRPVHFPLTYVSAPRAGKQALGFDLASDPGRFRFLRRARNSGRPVATPVTPLILGDPSVIVYRAVYRDGAPIRTVAQRRAALLGFVGGTFLPRDLAGTASGTLPNEVDLQLHINEELVAGPSGGLDDASLAVIHVADQSWLLVVRDPNRPDVSLPLLLAVVGISLAALLGALIIVWSRRERMQQLEREASHDPLTGLRNRRRFEEDLRAAMARSARERTTGALLMIDLDDFKSVNDTGGHPAGDRVIREVAGVLRRRARESDVLARLGGDEFAVVLPRCSKEEARIVAESISAAIRRYVPEDRGVEPITASVGVAMFGEDSRTSLATLVSEADTAMYAAKDGGRDGVVVFDQGAIGGELLGRD